jgi:hypothetical protein
VRRLQKGALAPGCACATSRYCTPCALASSASKLRPDGPGWHDEFRSSRGASPGTGESLVSKSHDSQQSCNAARKFNVLTMPNNKNHRVKLYCEPTTCVVVNSRLLVERMPFNVFRQSCITTPCSAPLTTLRAFDLFFRYHAVDVQMPSPHMSSCVHCLQCLVASRGAWVAAALCWQDTCVQHLTVREAEQIVVSGCPPGNCTSLPGHLLETSHAASCRARAMESRHGVHSTWTHGAGACGCMEPMPI